MNIKTFKKTDAKEHEAARLRYQQAMVDADIEGMADDPEYAALTDEMDREGLTTEQRLESLQALVRRRAAACTAVE